MLAPDAPAGGAAAATTKPETPAAPAAPDGGKKTAEPADLSGIADFVSTQLDGIKVKVAKKEQGGEPKGEPKDEPKGEPKDKGKGTKPPAPKKKPAPVMPPKAQTEPLSEERIAKAAAAGVAEVLDKRGRAKETEPPKVEPAQERKVTVLKRMEQLYPDRYTGISDKYLQSVKKLKDYAQRWEAEHPGEAFDESAAEHETFFAENDVEWNDEDYTEAIADIRADTRLEQANKETNAKLSSLERKEKLREAAPQIDAAQVSVARHFWERMGKDYSELLDANGGLNKAKAEAIRASDPIGFDIRIQAAVALENEVATIYRLMNGFEDYNADNAAHRTLGEFAEEQEKVLAAQPDAEKVDERGRRFLPAAEYHKIPRADAERYYWTFSVADLGALRAAEIGRNVEKIVAAEEAKYAKWAAARGIKVPDKSKTGANSEPAEESEEAEDTDGKPVSPSGGVEPKLAAVAAAAASSDPNPLSSFVERQIGKR